jgi:hypothetical protein
LQSLSHDIPKGDSGQIGLDINPIFALEEPYEKSFGQQKRLNSLRLKKEKDSWQWHIFRRELPPQYRLR